jgi:hypothetical protein
VDGAQSTTDAQAAQAAEIERLKAELAEARAAAAATQDDDEDDEPSGDTKKWIADTFDGSVVIHGVDGESVYLHPGDPIPAGHEDKVLPHIPTTTRKPRSARLREVNRSYGSDAPATDPDEVTDFQPGEHTVAQVVEYIEDHPEHAQIVLDRERGGKNRRTIFDKLGG